MRWIATAALLILATTLVTVAVPQRSEAATLHARLTAARHALRDARARLKTAEAALAAAIAVADPAPGATTAPTPASTPTGTPTPTASPTPSPSPSATPTLAELEARVRKARQAVRRWAKRVRLLTRQYRRQRQLAAWERSGDWMPIIKIAAAKYHVKAAGIYRMMMRESGGRRRAGSHSAYKGLFQYWTGTWAASWNPWRRDSIYDGSSQIAATCYAVGRGWGPRMWTTTFASEY